MRHPLLLLAAACTTVVGCFADDSLPPSGPPGARTNPHEFRPPPVAPFDGPRPPLVVSVSSACETATTHALSRDRFPGAAELVCGATELDAPLNYAQAPCSEAHDYDTCKMLPYCAPLWVGPAGCVDTCPDVVYYEGCRAEPLRPLVVALNRIEPCEATGGTWVGGQEAGRPWNGFGECRCPGPDSGDEALRHRHDDYYFMANEGCVTRSSLCERVGHTWTSEGYCVDNEGFQQTLSALIWAAWANSEQMHLN